ncbi:MAG: DUF5606 domain-containing protein [Bacteroidales bacterium]|nr:DUF5606 domain-containing protein [Bacteroidales bacterium]
MDLSKILMVSGKPGLFRLISQNQHGVVAESLLTGKTATIFSREPVSILNDICMYTNDGEIKLKEVLRTIYTKYEAQPITLTSTSGNILRKFMLEIVPDFDQEKVYNSDIQKLIKWYNLLLEKQLVDAEPDPEEEKTETEEKVDADTASAQ